jgi:5-methylcytosine-specific restriction endonuclease McrA
MSGQCEATWKVKHYSREYAGKALARLLQRDANIGLQRPMHVYLCRECHSYHIGQDRYAPSPAGFNRLHMEMWSEQKGQCGICGQPMTWGVLRDFDIDHIIPRSKGGKWNRANLQLAHRACNRLKADTYPYVPAPSQEETE